MKSRFLFLSFAILCWFSGDVATESYDDENEFQFDSSKKPEPCCLPATWHGFVKIIFGVAEGHRRARGGMVKTEMFVDGGKMRAGGKVNTGFPGSDFTFVGFFNQSTGRGFRFYSYKTYNATKCWTYYWDKFEYYKPCLPKTSTFKESIHIGLKDSALIANAWTINETRSGFKFIAEILVSEKDCIPIVLRDLGSAGSAAIVKEADDYDDKQGENSQKSKPRPYPFKKFVVGALYSDMELQIKDHKIFDLPAVCRRNLKRYPPKPEDVLDKDTKEGLEYLEAVMGHMMV